MATFEHTFEVDVKGSTYEVDAPDKATAWQWANTTHQQEIGNRLKRAAGLTARAVIQGAGDVAGILGNPISAMTGLRRPGDIAQELANEYTPAPKNRTERIVNAAGRGAVGAGLMVGGGQILSGAPGTIGKFGKILAIQPEAQMISGGAAGAASENARENGAGPGMQFVHGTVAGMVAPSIVNMSRSTPGLVKNLINKPEPVFVAPPSQTPHPGWTDYALEALSGKAKTEQKATAINYPITENKITSALNLPKGTPLSTDLLDNFKAQVYDDSYLPVKQSGMVRPNKNTFNDISASAKEANDILQSFPNTSAVQEKIVTQANNLLNETSKPIPAGVVVDKIRALRQDATKAYNSSDEVGGPALGKALKDMAKALEDGLTEHLNSISAFLPNGKSTIKGFAAGRQKIAMANSIEDAMLKGVDNAPNINALKLRDQLQRGVPLSGGLRDIAKQASAYPKTMSIPVSGADNPITLPTLGMSGLMGSAGAGISAGAGAGPVGMGVGGTVGALLPFTRIPARSLIMSQPYQRMLQGREVGNLYDPLYRGLLYGDLATNQ